jgi:hypothetical protein
MAQGDWGGTDRRARIAVARAAEQRIRKRNRVLLAAGAIVVVVGIVVGFVALSGGNSGTAMSSTPLQVPTGSELDAIVHQVTTVPASALERVAAGTTSQLPQKISGTALTANGKPELLYIGAEYCPFCAAERWAMIVALSRFGTFNGLAATHSAAKNGAGNPEPYPNTPTFTFADSTFTSDYLTFTPVETNTNVPDPSTGGYTTLQTLTAQQQELLAKYDAAYQGAIPFLDYGNKYMSVGASYDPAVLKNLTWQQIAADLHDPATPVAQAVLGAANYSTAAICGLTGDRPASVCTPMVRGLRAKI